MSPRLVSSTSSGVLAEGSPAAPALSGAVERDETKASDAVRIIGRPVKVHEQALERVRNSQYRTLASAVKTILGVPPAEKPKLGQSGPYRTVVVVSPVQVPGAGWGPLNPRQEAFLWQPGCDGHYGIWRRATCQN